MLVSILAVVVSLPLCAQEAQSLLDASAKLYATAKSYSAKVESRAVQFVFAPSPAGETPRYEVSGSFYQRVQIKVSHPNGYWLGLQALQEGEPIYLGSSGGRFVSTGGVGSLLMIARSENGAVKRGEYLGNKFRVMDMAPETLAATVTQYLGARAGGDLVLRYYPVDTSAPAGTLPFGLIEPDLIGKETVNGQTLCRIAAKTSDGDPVTLWINPSTFLLDRVIVQRTVASMGMRMLAPGMAPGSGPAARPTKRLCLQETFYTNQRVNMALTSSDFAMTAPVGMEKLEADRMGFGPTAALAKFAEIPVDSNPGVSPPAPEIAPAVPAAPATPAATANAGGQALSREQMAGIVLIEGDGSSGTGFMVKMKEVDFVVTNLHVLGNNKKLSLKTLSGEELQMLGVFGAVGRDIAIIRIAKGQGSLVLASDVFASSQIGDKVVVVGNRLGGGVATQTEGSILGVGPVRVEVNANFEPGNSGSPIVNLSTKEVLGVATYAETHEVEVEASAPRSGYDVSARVPRKVEKRWFGYRLDSVPKWEAIDLSLWNAQDARIAKFRETTEALHAIIQLNFKVARQHPRFASAIDNFDTRCRAMANNSAGAALEVKDFFRLIRTISDDGVKDLMVGDYYDYYRTSLYWGTSIPAQLEYRKAVIEVLKKYEANSTSYLSRLRGGS